jgi:hypothetical protein
LKALCIIPCGKKKIWDADPHAGPIPAGEAYIGTLHKKSRAYAENFCTDFRILSAKHGFLRKEDILEANYDVSFHSPSAQRISKQQLKEQYEEQGLFKYDYIIGLTGRKYRPYLEGAAKEQKIFYPLENITGIGYILQELQKAVDNNQPFPLEKE